VEIGGVCCPPGRARAAGGVGGGGAAATVVLARKREALAWFQLAVQTAQIVASEEQRLYDVLYTNDLEALLTSSSTSVAAAALLARDVFGDER